MRHPDDGAAVLQDQDLTAKPGAGVTPTEKPADDFGDLAEPWGGQVTDRELLEL